MPYTPTHKSSEAAVELQLAKPEERAHVTSVRGTVTANGGTFNLNLRNPAGNDKVANIHGFTVDTQFEALVDVFDTFTSAPSGGTEPSIDNLLMDTEQVNGEGTMTVREDVTFTGDNVHLTSVIPSGGPGGTIGGSQSEPTPIIEPDREIVVEVTNQSGSDNEAAITIVYSEAELTEQP